MRFRLATAAALVLAAATGAAGQDRTGEPAPAAPPVLSAAEVLASLGDGCMADDPAARARLEAERRAAGLWPWAPGCFELWTACGDISTDSVVGFPGGVASPFAGRVPGTGADTSSRMQREADAVQAGAVDAVEARLRAAGLFTGDYMGGGGDLELHVNFTDSGRARVELQFKSAAGCATYTGSRATSRRGPVPRTPPGGRSKSWSTCAPGLTSS